MRNRQEFPGVSHFRDRHGKLRWRYREGRFTASLGTDYGSPEFLRRYNAALKGERLSNGEASSKVSQAPAGSLTTVIEDWYKSAAFVKLSDSTKKAYRGRAESLRAEHGDKRVKGLTVQAIERMMAKKARIPNAANHMLKMLRFLIDHAIKLQIMEVNPARSVKLFSTLSEGIHAWEEDEIDAFRAVHEEGSLADLAMSLMLYTGAARSDVVHLGPHSIRNNRLSYRRQKMKGRKGVLIDIPIHPELWRRIEPLMGQATFLETVHGDPRSPMGLGGAMSGWTTDAGIPHCSSHGLRKAIARRLAEAGSTVHEIAAVTGHKSLSEVQRYTEAANRATGADSAFAKADLRKES